MKILNIIIKSVKYLLIAAMIFVFISNFYIMAMSAKNPGSHPSVLGYSTAIVISGSMEPAIGIDDLIVVKNKKNYKVNDIIAFTADETYTTHRIVGEKDGGFITKGDANNTADKHIVKHEDIVGKVVMTVPSMGKIVDFLRSPLGMMLIVLFAFGIYLIPDKEDEE